MATGFVGVKMTPAELDILDWLVARRNDRSRSETLRDCVRLQALHEGLKIQEVMNAEDERKNHPQRRRSRPGTKARRRAILGDV